MIAYPRCLVILASFLLSSSFAFAGEFSAFGPLSYQRGQGTPITETTTFTVKDPTAPYVLKIYNGGKNNEFSRVSSAQVRLNGIVVVPTSAFNQNIGFIERPVSVNDSNTLSVELRSIPGSGFTLEIIGDDLVPPSVSITSPSDGLKTKETQIKVTGSASDATTSVASVTVNGEPATLTGDAFEADVTLVEGANTISAQATDFVGNQAQVSITVIRDTTPPNVAITRPANLSTFNTNTITVSGTASDSTTSVASVTVNGLPAVLSGGAFSLTLDIGEGTRFITAVASDLLGNTSTASISITIDTTPPRVIINSPSDSATLFSSPITVSGMINDIVSGTVNGNNATVTVNGTQASVSNRGFIADGISLSPGTNTITAIGRDTAGNQSSTSITVTLDTKSQSKIKVISGNNQTGFIGSTLPLPLVVQLVDSRGSPVANKPVTFSVIRNDGTLDGGKRSVTFNTDSQGKAQVTLTLGSHSGSGENQVEATASGFSGKAIFYASGTANNASMIQQINESVFRGEVNNALPSPLQVIVTDSEGNPVQGIPITFTVVAGGGKVDNAQTTTIITNSDGKAHVVWILGPEEGISNNIVEATFSGNTGSPVTFVASSVIPGDPLATSFLGIVLTNTNEPIPDVTITIAGTDLTTKTDDQGVFKLTSVPVGAIHLIADGSTSTLPGLIFPYALMFETNAISGDVNTLGMPIYLVPIDQSSAKPVSPTQSALVSVLNISGFSLTIPAGSASFDNGTQGTVSVSQVHKDKVPMPPPNGMNPKIVFTIQPEDVSFDPPAPIVYPNVYGYPQGKIVDLFSFDHHLGQWVSIGTGSVTDDGAFIASDNGVGIIHGGWHFPAPPPPQNTCTAPPCTAGDPNPIDCKVPAGGDPCSPQGCLTTNLPQGTDCGTSESNPFAPSQKKICRFCDTDGGCQLGFQPSQQDTVCNQTADSAALYDCRIGNAFRRFIGAQRNPTIPNGTTGGVHCGMLNCNIPGCMEEDATEQTCRPVSRSFHYCDRARDFRSRDMCTELKDAIDAALPGAMGGGNAIIEDRGNTNEHFHVEFPRLANEQCRNGVRCGGTDQPTCQNCQWVPLQQGQQPTPGQQTETLNGQLHVLVCQ